MSIFLGLIIVFSLCFGGRGADAEAVGCLMCHGQLSKEKVVHAAVQMGCPTCHTGIDANDVPHKKLNTISKGLSSEQPDICYGCHDKAKFQKKTVHAAVGMGCTGCHNPHSSKNEKLLVADLPDLCFNCHDKASIMNKSVVHPPVAGGMCLSCHNPHSSDNKKLLLAEAPGLCYNCHDKGMFSKKNVHSPVAGGMCLSCHSPHATDEMALLQKRPMAVCLDCHPDVVKKRHVTAESKHPLGSLKKKDDKKSDKKPGKKERGPLTDPARAGKEFYCGSCHNPHSSDAKRLMRYKANTPFELCINCHKK